MLSSLTLREFFFLFFFGPFFGFLVHTRPPPLLPSSGCDFDSLSRARFPVQLQKLADAETAFAVSFRIQTWALEEARRRLEIEGILDEPSSEK
jgi:hypothetical protein